MVGGVGGEGREGVGAERGEGEGRLFRVYSRNLDYFKPCPRSLIFTQAPWTRSQFFAI
jgi:hypothetical protein